MAQVPATTQTNHSTTTYTGSKFPYEIYVTPECLVKMNEYGRAAQPTEIGGLARLEINRETKNIFVTDIHVFPQRAEAAYFEIPEDAMLEWTREMLKAGRGDELAEWKSIFHTHPVGMGPSMSGHDVDQIMQFAQEEDAFSFILSASNNADSSRMFMHYCCNMYGEKYVIRDIAVKTSISADRVELSDQMTKYLTKKLGGRDALNDEDVQRLDRLVTEFLTSKVPMYFSEGRAKLRDDIEQHVKAVVKQTPMWTNPKKGQGYTPEVGNYAAGAQQATQRQQQAHAIENDAMHAMLQDAVARGEMTQSDADEYWSQLNEEEQEYLGYGGQYDRGYSYNRSDKFADELKVIEHLYALAFDGYDSEFPNREVSKKRMKKSARMWELRVKKLNEKLRKETEEGIGLYDLVLVDYSKVKTNPNNQQGSDLDSIPHTVDTFIHDRTGFSFEVGGELFWSHELKINQKFEDKMQSIRDQKAEEAILRGEQQRVDEQAALKQASDELEEALQPSTPITTVIGGK